MKTLEYKKIDIDPDDAPDILVPLGGNEYVAHCPNAYEFVALLTEVRKMQEDPTNINVLGLAEAFFKPSDVRDIDRKCRTREIGFIEELAPALTALADHYRPYVEKNMAKVNEKLSAKK